MRRLDAFGWMLAWGLVTFLLGAGGAAVICRFITLGDLALLVGLGAILIAAHRTRPAPAPFQNTYAHGAARVADEAEAHLAAVRGGTANPLDQMDFKD